MVSETPVTFRPLLKEMLNLLSLRKIPLLVFSAGLADIIRDILTSEEGFLINFI